MAINLHNIIGDALSIVNDWQEFVFTKTVQSWSVNSREPSITTTTETIKGKLQPANNQEVEALGFDVNTYQYYKIYVSGEPTQLDRVRQLGSDTFICNNMKYRIVGKFPWDDGGWRKAFCYLEEEIKPSENNEVENDGNTDL